MLSKQTLLSFRRIFFYSFYFILKKNFKKILKQFFFYCKQIHVHVQIKLQIRGLNRQQFNYQIFQKF